MSPVALVTGSARGIGRAIALRIADDGFDVSINDLASRESELASLKHEIELKGRRCAVVPADVSDEQSVAQMIATTVSQLERLDVMVANAGVILVKPLLEIEASEWTKVQEVNINGVFLCYKHAAKQMIQQGQGGKIIGACSIAGYRGGPQAPAYSASKWAVRGLTQAAAQELGPHGITVNAYCPGMIRTDMWNTIDSTLGAKMGLEKGQAWEKAVKARTSTGRTPSPEDIAALVGFLVGRGADHITGQSIIVDDGIVFS